MRVKCQHNSRILANLQNYKLESCYLGIYENFSSKRSIILTLNASSEFYNSESRVTGVIQLTYSSFVHQTCQSSQQLHHTTRSQGCTFYHRWNNQGNSYLNDIQITGGIIQVNMGRE